jgi:hypothetical protein
VNTIWYSLKNCVHDILAYVFPSRPQIESNNLTRYLSFRMCIRIENFHLNERI